MMHEQAHCHDEAANHQMPITVAFWIIRIASAEDCSSLTGNLVQIHCSTHSVILNVMATQYTAHSVLSTPHWLVQWSPPCSHMHIPVHSPWLPVYIDVAQTSLVIFTMAGLFPDRPYTVVCVCLFPLAALGVHLPIGWVCGTLTTRFGWGESQKRDLVWQ